MDGFEIRQIPSKGRALFATRNFKCNEIIFEEDPWISCQFSWNKQYNYKACDYCMRPLETAEQNAQRLSGCSTLELPYKSSCIVTSERHTKCFQCGECFCDETCLEKANHSYHTYVCINAGDDKNPLKILEDAWKKMHYPPETCSINLLVRILAKIKSSGEKEVLMEDLLRFTSRLENTEDRIAHKMLGENFAQQLETLYSLMLSAMEPSEGVEQLLTPAGFRSLFAVIATNAQGIGTSSFAAWVKNVENLELEDKKQNELDALIDQIYEQFNESVGSFLNCEGSGLYKLQSTINHSCSPNAQCTFPYSNHKLVLEALRDINAGEEICISYLDECSLERSRHSRMRVLAENYLFICHCEKCELQAGDPDVTSDEETDEDISM